jgi:hypothetical protein
MASTQEQYRLGTLSDEDFLARTNSIVAAMRANNPSRRTSFTPPALPPSAPSLPGLRPPGIPHPSQTDRLGSGPWPITHRSIGSFQLFQQDTGFSDNAYGAETLWAALPEDQKEAYRARAEAQRRDAWASYETRLARKDAGLMESPPPPPPPFFFEHFGLLYPSPKPVLRLSGFEVFRDELVASHGMMGFGELLARWEGLPDEQRGPYEKRA